MGSEKYRRNHSRKQVAVVIHSVAKNALLLACLTGSSGAVAEAGADDWLEQDFEAVNEGVLEIMQEKPAIDVHFHQQWLTLTQASLESGWVAMRQCHRHLDQVADMQIVYRAGRIRDLEIESFSRIGKAWISGNSVQLQSVKANSAICINARTKALEMTDGAFELKNGPFMRRFLDGYYPMRLRMEVNWPAALLQLERTLPVESVYRPGEQTSIAVMDLWFSGRLDTVFVFRNRFAGEPPPETGAGVQ